MRGGNVSKARIERNFHTRNRSWKKKYPEWDAILSEAKKIRYEYKRVYDQKWGKLVNFFSHKQIHWNKELMTKRLEKYKKTVNDAMVLSLHNLPPVPGMTVIMIKYVERGPRDDEKRQNMIKTKNNQALILAACAISCCQDTMLFVSKSQLGGDSHNIVALEFNPRKSLLENVDNWRSKIEEIRRVLTLTVKNSEDFLRGEEDLLRYGVDIALEFDKKALFGRELLRDYLSKCRIGLVTF